MAIGDISGFGRRLARTRIVTRSSMMLERIWPLALPFVIVASLYLSASWFGLFRLMPDELRLGLVIAFGLAALAALIPLRFFRSPANNEIDRRIERANELRHAPVSAQTDRPSPNADGFGQALWREHQKRMAERLGRLESDLPRTGVPDRDPWGLRAAAALIFVIAFAFSFGPFGGSVADAFTAHGGRNVVPPRIDAWVTPPPYTRKAPIFLTADTNRNTTMFTVPEDSEVVVRVTGGAGSETLAFTDTDGITRDLDAGLKGEADAKKTNNAPATPGNARQFTGKLVTDGTLELTSGESEIERWAFSIIPDKPPIIRFDGEPQQAVNGTLELNYTIEDDYGAASAKAEFELADEQAPDAHPLYEAPEMPLTLPRHGAKNNSARTTHDLTRHVWAGASVRLTLKATDAAGHEAANQTKIFKLPERPFTNPLARAVIEQRRIFSLDAKRKRRALDLLDAVTLRPEDTFDNVAHYLVLMSARTRLAMAAGDDQLRDVSDYMWDIALGIEDGDLSAAEKRLRQAQEALKQALENGASDAELDKLMKELREAMNEFLREFAERARQNPNMAQQMPSPGQEMRQSDLERMLDQIENMAKSGNRDKAREMLSQLQDMMNNLQAGQHREGPQGQQNSQMRQQMDKLGEIMRRQQEMMNETFRMDQMQRGQPRGGRNGEQEGQNRQQGENGQGGQGRPMTPEEFAEALKQLQQGQGQLQRDLEALTKGLQGLGIQPGEGFGEAGDAMGEAEGALGKGDGERATGEQGRALEALRKGAQDMMQQMQQAMEGDRGGGEEGGRQQNSDRDPLGRPRATTGPDFGNSVKVPDEIDVQRARRILEAIRKRLGNALSPELERSYLERLLDLK